MNMLHANVNKAAGILALTLPDHCRLWRYRRGGTGIGTITGFGSVIINDSAPSTSRLKPACISMAKRSASQNSSRPVWAW
jgi:hypothetical protein